MTSLCVSTSDRRMLTLTLQAAMREIKELHEERSQLILSNNRDRVENRNCENFNSNKLENKLKFGY